MDGSFPFRLEDPPNPEKDDKPTQRLDSTMTIHQVPQLAKRSSAITNQSRRINSRLHLRYHQSRMKSRAATAPLARTGSGGDGRTPADFNIKARALEVEASLAELTKSLDTLRRMNGDKTRPSGDQKADNTPKDINPVPQPLPRPATQRADRFTAARRLEQRVRELRDDPTLLKQFSREARALRLEQKQRAKDQRIKQRKRQRDELRRFMGPSWSPPPW
eukprot:gnl/Dysnectes_brevis/6095_a9188_313.p1 GENE.gnl/Dysnectes_brevis/6095_a9188_313~~gnl/Dysnectes_brevis/6095_a9188_313.p1  ORF type:complete len:219 (+),score=59.52 gnl/Dysnectes_brevis/6095_a9188_313:58-714(+)